MVFISEIQFEYDEKSLERIVKSLRHMGLSRNRGLGNVSCSMEHVEFLPESGTVPICSGDQTPARLDYQIVNIQPLMMSAINDNRSEKYISGQNVLGALAGIYLEKQKSSTADGDELFEDLFLNGNVCYSNLYISDKKQDGREMIPYVPIPLFLNELKKTKEIVNITKTYDGRHYGTEGRLDAGNGNQPKKLKEKYGAIMENGISIRILEPETDIEFHHTNKKSYASDSAEDGQLYSFTVLRQGQYFAGSIYGKKCHLEILKWLLEHGALRMGKSKTAQYGACSVSYMQIKDTGKKDHVKAGEEILAVLESDGIFLDPELGYTNRYEKALKRIAEDLKISYEIPAKRTGTNTGNMCEAFRTGKLEWPISKWKNDKNKRKNKTAVQKKHYYRIEFCLSSAMAVGSGQNIMTDKDILRNSIGEPYIPGTALAGIYHVEKSFF